MKSTFLKTLFVSVVSLTLVLVISLVVGCGPKDPPQDPDLIPTVPPSTRGGKGGTPGAAGDVNKRKKTSAIFYTIPSELKQS